MVLSAMYSVLVEVPGQFTWNIVCVNSNLTPRSSCTISAVIVVQYIPPPPKKPRQVRRNHLSFDVVYTFQIFDEILVSLSTSKLSMNQHLNVVMQGVGHNLSCGVSNDHVHWF